MLNKFRGLRFRVWTTFQKRFLFTENGLDFSKVLDEKYIYGEYSSHLSDFIFEDKLNPWKIQQSTGLADKNGQEICEGDIICIDGKKESLVGVYFQYGCFGVKSSDYGSFYHFLNNTLFDLDLSKYIILNAEVVGNVFENTELIKK